MTSGLNLDPADVASLPLFAQAPDTTGRASLLVGETRAPEYESDSNTVDWSLVAALRSQASERLSQAIAGERGRLDQTAQQELGRAIVLDLIESAMADAVNEGTPANGVQQDRSPSVTAGRGEPGGGYRLMEAVEGRTDDVLSLPARTGGLVRVHPVIFH